MTLNVNESSKLKKQMMVHRSKKTIPLLLMMSENNYKGGVSGNHSVPVTVIYPWWFERLVQ